MTPVAPDVDELLSLYRAPLASRLYDEAVTELEHALQAGALALGDDRPDSIVAAALLHDVGHLVLGDPARAADEPRLDTRHERVGAAFLGSWFGPEVTRPVALHVTAKRHLCATEPRYLEGLSPASRRSLALQGGPLTSAESERFLARPR
ncbi:MAG: HD domain-containing protein [Acidimicrobiales bacterium]